ncbi:MAG: caspase family protein [Rhizobiales bacterium]|nr:caspase family protein [Hyphomicrobiales bacterium]
MKFRGLLASLVLVYAGLAVVPAIAANRVALVIGNSDYKHTPRLKNPSNDATDVAAALQRLGFDVVRGLDLDHAGMREQVRRFTEKLPGAEAALFFYAGHGLQVAGKNYLAPVDARLESEADLDFNMVDLDLVLRNMERTTRTNIAFLDACRNNPLAANLARKMGTRSASIGRGLAAVESGVGTLIAFATQPGNIALDGEGRNSPFTTALLGAIERPGVPLSDVMIGVRREVLKQTSGKQVPWEHSSLTGQFYFTPPVPGASATTLPPEPDPAALEITFWESIKNEKNPRLFEAYLKRYPKGAFADIARITLEETKTAALKPAAPVSPVSDEKLAISDPGLLRELRDRLYELNFDPGAIDGPLGEPARQAIREFEASSKLAQTGVPTSGLLRRLREVGGLKPWGAIVYAKSNQKWGMSWSHATRKEAVAGARASCGDVNACTTEISFFGTECGAFVHSGTSWSMAARDDIQKAKEATLADCRKRSKNCSIVATVCADGADRFASGH